MLAVPQVFSAKVVTNARSPGSKCYGLVTMSSSAEVARCISHLDRTELHGQQISVERVSVLSHYLPSGQTTSTFLLGLRHIHSAVCVRMDLVCLLRMHVQLMVYCMQ